MRLSDAEIERIVREVIRRLTAAGSEVACHPPATLRLEERLISLATLKGRLDGIRKLEVSLRAVVTPSVYDELRDKNIDLVRMEPS